MAVDDATPLAPGEFGTDEAEITVEEAPACPLGSGVNTAVLETTAVAPADTPLLPRGLDNVAHPAVGVALNPTIPSDVGVSVVLDAETLVGAEWAVVVRVQSDSFAPYFRGSL